MANAKKPARKAAKPVMAWAITGPNNRIWIASWWSKGDVLKILNKSYGERIARVRIVKVRR